MNIIKNPVISEKSLGDAKDGYYTFVVDRAARKQEIAKAIEQKFDVNVIDINTSNFKDEKKQQRRVRSTYTIAGYKKAVVKLKTGQKIALFEAETAEVETAEEPTEVKEKKSILKGTKVKIEKMEDKKKKEDK
ncbi:MAG: 50S ribosomal protein L23 [Candidatus Daviesbacteria bacterium]|nr:50S ribosomal protein L23 [Candidatus Daviesbacteria bacterium]